MADAAPQVEPGRKGWVARLGALVVAVVVHALHLICAAQVASLVWLWPWDPGNRMAPGFGSEPFPPGFWIAIVCFGLAAFLGGRAVVRRGGEVVRAGSRPLRFSYGAGTLGLLLAPFLAWSFLDPGLSFWPEGAPAVVVAMALAGLGGVASPGRRRHPDRG